MYLDDLYRLPQLLHQQIPSNNNAVDRKKDAESESLCLPPRFNSALFSRDPH